MIPPHGARAERPLRDFSALLLLLVLAGLGPDPAAAEESAPSPLKAGAWAIEFELDPEYQYVFGLGGAATLAAKRMWTDRTGLRFGASIGYSEEESEGESNRFIVNPSYPGGIGGRFPEGGGRETHDYAIFAHLRRHHPVRERVSIHWEVGPSFRYLEYDAWNEDVYFYGPEYSSYRETTTRRGVYLDARIGFEWNFAGRLALGASYGAYGGYQWGKGTYYRTYRREDGLYSSTDQNFRELRRADFSTSRATVSFTAYL